MKTDVCVMGAGPAGLFASIFSAKSDAKTILAETNTTACRKLLRTGRFRCNLTHTGSIEDFIKAYGVFGRFLRHCLYELSADDLRQHFADRGLKTKVEKNGCVFPVTDRAGDVAHVLLEDTRRLSVRLLFGRKVRSISKDKDTFVVEANQDRIAAHSVIIATGGVTWPFTGSTGDGYEFARSFGHTIIEPRASLAPLVTAEIWPKHLSGVSLKNVVIKTKIDNRVFSARGPMIFTNDGIGGPAVFDISRFMTDFLPSCEEPVKITIDLIPKYTPEQLDLHIISLCSRHPQKEITSVLTEFLPRSLVMSLCRQLYPQDSIPAGRLQKNQRRNMVKMLKHLPLSIVSTCPIDKATVARGGVDIKEINPRTMESKLCPGLFFAGEVINVDGPCGGYNLQIAFSTGYLAGKSASSSVKLLNSKT